MRHGCKLYASLWAWLEIRNQGRGNSHPATKTCPFTPVSKDRSPWTPSHWGELLDLEMSYCTVREMVFVAVIVPEVPVTVMV
jgi:hypothetical protein